MGLLIYCNFFFTQFICFLANESEIWMNSPTNLDQLIYRRSQLIVVDPY